MYCPQQKLVVHVRDDSEVHNSEGPAKEVLHQEPANALTWLARIIVLQRLQVYLILTCQLAVCGSPLQDLEIPLGGQSRLVLQADRIPLIKNCCLT